MLVSLDGHWVLVCIPGWPAGTCADVCGWSLGSCVGISGWPLGTSAGVPGWPLDTCADVPGWPLGTCADVPGWPLGTCMGSTTFILKRRSERGWGGRPAWVHQSTGHFRATLIASCVNLLNGNCEHASLFNRKYMWEPNKPFSQDGVLKTIRSTMRWCSHVKISSQKSKAFWTWKCSNCRR